MNINKKGAHIVQKGSLKFCWLTRENILKRQVHGGNAFFLGRKWHSHLTVIKMLE